MAKEKWYFVTTIAHKAANKMKPLSGQFFDDGSEVIATMNVQADKAVRRSHPLGTIFAAQNLILERNGFLRADPLEVVPVADEHFEVFSDVSEELKNAFEEWRHNNPNATNEGDGSMSVNAPPARKIPTLLERLNSDSRFKIPTIKEDGFWVDKDVWDMLITNQDVKENTLIVGPTGSGKTELGQRVSKAANKIHYCHEMGLMIDPQSNLLGTHRLIPNLEGGGAISQFDYSAFCKDIQGPCDINFNELNRSPLATMNILFPMLDDQRRLPVEIADSGHSREIKVHEAVWFMATANIGAEYGGTQDIDAALLNRFDVVELGYPPAAIEAELLVRRREISPRDAKSIADIAQEIRKLADQSDLSKSISTRQTLKIGKKVRQGFGVKKACELILLPIFEGTKDSGERCTVIQIIKKH